jgi:hypothetical protein
VVATVFGTTLASVTGLVPSTTYSFTVKALDAAGNASAASAPVSVTTLAPPDTTPPVLTVTAPVDGATVQSGTVTVVGKATDQALAQVTVQGVPVSVAADGTFQTTVSLQAGDNVIVVTAVDVAGNQSPKSVHVTFSDGAPTIQLMDPPDQFSTTSSIITVRGKVSGGTGTVIVTVNGARVAVGADGTFLAPLELAVGAATVSVTATDASGATASATSSGKRSGGGGTGGGVEPSTCPGLAFTYDAVGSMTGVYRVCSDPDNCGAVGNVCKAPEGAAPACVNGGCALIADGGTVYPAKDPSNCGTLKHQCGSVPNGYATCDGGICGVACNGNATLIGGACLDLSTDPNNCSAAGNVCRSTPNGTAVCDHGNCAIWANGQLVDVDWDPMNCGDVGEMCPGGQYGHPTCNGGVCALECDDGYAPDQERCLDLLSDPANCGLIANVCPGAGDGAATCTRGVCGTMGKPVVLSVNGVSAPSVLFEAPWWFGLEVAGTGLEKITYLELEDWGPSTIDGVEASIPTFTGIVVPTTYGGARVAFSSTRERITIPGSALNQAVDAAHEWYKVRLHYTGEGGDESLLVDFAISFDDDAPINAPPPSIVRIDSVRETQVPGRYSPSTGFIPTMEDLTLKASPPFAVLARDLLDTEYPILKITADGVYIQAGIDPSEITKTVSSPWDGQSFTALVYQYGGGARDTFHLGVIESSGWEAGSGMIARGTNLYDDGMFTYVAAVSSSGQLAGDAYGERLVVREFGYELNETLIAGGEPCAMLQYESSRGGVALPGAVTFSGAPRILAVAGEPVPDGYYNTRTPIVLSVRPEIEVGGFWLANATSVTIGSHEPKPFRYEGSKLIVSLPSYENICTVDGSPWKAWLAVYNEECAIPYACFTRSVPLEFTGVRTCPPPEPPPDPPPEPPKPKKIDKETVPTPYPTRRPCEGVSDATGAGCDF